MVFVLNKFSSKIFLVSSPVFKMASTVNIYFQFFLAFPVLLYNFPWNSMSFQLMNLLPYVAKLCNSVYNKFVFNKNSPYKHVVLEHKS